MGRPASRYPGMKLEAIALALLSLMAVAAPLQALALKIGDYAVYKFNMTYGASLPRHQSIAVDVSGVLTYRVDRMVELGNRTVYTVTVRITQLEVKPLNGTSGFIVNAVKARLSQPLVIAYTPSQCSPIPTPLAGLGAMALPFYCKPSNLNLILEALRNAMPGLKAGLRKTPEGYLLTATGSVSRSINAMGGRANLTEALELSALYNPFGVLARSDSSIYAKLYIGNATGYIVSRLHMELLQTSIGGALPAAAGKNASRQAILAAYAALAGIAVAVVVAAAAARRG